MNTAERVCLCIEYSLEFTCVGKLQLDGSVVGYQKVTILRDEFSTVFGFCEKSKMAASFMDFNAADVADCLNVLSLIRM